MPRVAGGAPPAAESGPTRAQEDAWTPRRRTDRSCTRASEPASAAGSPSATPQILAFERQWWKYAGAKEQAIRELFDMSATRYYQVLNALIDSPAALAHDPMLVKRLRRMRLPAARAHGPPPRGRLTARWAVRPRPRT